MPSHTAASALIKLYSLDGAPWAWLTWQEITGVRYGLFPDDDSKLPKKWTRQTANDILSYFNAYAQQPTEDKKIAFAAANAQSGLAYPGRALWKSWVSSNWNSWKIHHVVVEELREYEIHPLSIILGNGGDDFTWPSADGYLPMILDSLGMRLFGEEAFLDSRAVLSTDLRKCLQIFAQRSWSALRSQTNTMRNKSTTIEETALAAFNGSDTPTKAKVSRAIRAVAKWKECAELFSTPSNVKKAADMLSELEAILEGMGAQLEKKLDDKKPQRKGFCRVENLALRHLATEEDVSDVVNLYHEYFNQECEEDDPPITDILPAQRQLNDSGVDSGMEEEATMSEVALALALGFSKGVPVIFNEHRDRTGLNPWDNAESFVVDKGSRPPSNLSKVTLHWHQSAGVHSIIRSVFSTERDDSAARGSLIADEVGLGKTLQAIAFVAFLIQAIAAQAVGRTPPKVLASWPFLGPHEKIPILPHLILCPGTLIAQWHAELKTFLKPRSVDIFVYDTPADSYRLWGPKGLVSSSKHKPHQRIVIVSHSTLAKDLSKFFLKPRKGRDTRAWDEPEVKGSTKLEHTIFGHNFLTIIVDEAHHFRNRGNKHTAVLRLLRQATVRIIMTATPLHTSPRDVGAMGRLVGCTHFFTEASYEEEKADEAAIRRAKKFDDDGATVLSEQLKAVNERRRKLEGHFLRRTTASVDYKGQELIPLPPCKEIIGVVNLTERETEIIKARAEAAKESVENSSSSKKIKSKIFYLEYRIAVGYSKDTPEGIFPTFNSLEAWRPVMSTKMDVTARICAHYLTHDEVPDVDFENGAPVFPEIASLPPGQTKRTRRIIIYSEFRSMVNTLQSVLKLYGVKSLAINGKVTFAQRNKDVRNLYDDRHPARVLIFSSVGSAGLNLSIADVVIFFDQPWSAQDERQIRGRAHRQPQAKAVKVIHLLANDSADLLMNEVARNKRDMFESFVNKEQGAELQRLLQGFISDSGLVNDEEVEELPRGALARKKRAKKSTAVINVDDEQVNDPPEANSSEVVVADQTQAVGQPGDAPLAAHSDATGDPILFEEIRGAPDEIESASEPEMSFGVDEIADSEVLTDERKSDGMEVDLDDRLFDEYLNLQVYDDDDDGPPSKRVRRSSPAPEEQAEEPAQIAPSLSLHTSPSDPQESNQVCRAAVSASAAEAPGTISAGRPLAQAGPKKASKLSPFARKAGSSAGATGNQGQRSDGINPFVQKSAPQNANPGQVSGNFKAAAPASLSVTPSSTPAAPSSRPAAPSPRPAAPSPRPAAPSSRPAAPSSRPAAPSSRPAIPSSSLGVQGRRPGALRDVTPWSQSALKGSQSSKRGGRA